MFGTTMAEMHRSVRELVHLARNEAIAEEREACAKLAATCDVDPYRDSNMIANVRMDIAAAIRAKS